jgi:DNA modification methylase
MKKMPDNSVDAVITDPPFGIGFKYNEHKDHKTPELYWEWFEPIYKEILRVSKDGALIAIWQAQLNFRHFWDWFGDDIHIYIGAKNFVQLRKTPINYGYDPIVMKYKSGTPLRPLKPKRSIDFFVANTAKFVTEKNSLAKQHPCPRPIDQVIQIVENFSIGTVLDPFMGSGTTGVACNSLGRDFIGIEINEVYYGLAQKRTDESKKEWLEVGSRTGGADGTWSFLAGKDTSSQ